MGITITTSAKGPVAVKDLKEGKWYLVQRYGMDTLIRRTIGGGAVTLTYLDREEGPMVGYIAHYNTGGNVYDVREVGKFDISVALR